MRGSSEQSLQHAFDRFSDGCDQARTTISTKKIEVLCLSRRPRRFILQMSGNTLQQAGADPASQFRGGRFQLVFGSQVSLRVYYCKRDEVDFATLL